MKTPKAVPSSAAAITADGIPFPAFVLEPKTFKSGNTGFYAQSRHTDKTHTYNIQVTIVKKPVK